VYRCIFNKSLTQLLQMQHNKKYFFSCLLSLLHFSQLSHQAWYCTGWPTIFCQLLNSMLLTKELSA